MTGNVFSDPNITQKLMQPESLITQRICNILTLPEKGRSSIPTLQKKKKKNQIKRKKPDHEPQNGLGRSASRASSPSPKPRPQTPVPSPPPSRKPARVRG